METCLPTANPIRPLQLVLYYANQIVFLRLPSLAWFLVFHPQKRNSWLYLMISAIKNLFFCEINFFLCVCVCVCFISPFQRLSLYFLLYGTCKNKQTSIEYRKEGLYVFAWVNDYYDMHQSPTLVLSLFPYYS